MIQRRLRVGYTRAGRLIDMLERRGVISGYEGSKPRQVLITQADLSRVLSPPAAGRAERARTGAESTPRATPELCGSFPAVIRAGIVVTGTEVLTGRISDRNGPWVSEQLAGHGVEVAHILIVGDRPEDLEAALRFMADEGMDLIITSGGLGPTADDLTAEVVARFAGRELVLDEEMLEKIAEILRGFAKRFRLDEAAVLEANRKQAMVPEGSVALDPEGTAPGLVVPAGERVVIVSCPGPPRELQPMWKTALAAEPVREVLARSTPLRRLHDADVRRPGVRNRQEPARDRGRWDRPGRGRDHHLPAARRDRDRRPLPRRGDRGRRGGARGARRAPPTGDVQPRRRDDRRSGGRAAAGAQAGPGGVL